MVHLLEKSSSGSKDFSKVDLKDIENEIHLYEIKIVAKKNEIEQLRMQLKLNESNCDKENCTIEQSDTTETYLKINEKCNTRIECRESLKRGTFRGVSRTSRMVKKSKVLDQKLQRVLKAIKNI